MNPKLYHSSVNSIFAAQLIAADERRTENLSRAERLRSFRGRDAEGTAARTRRGRAAVRSAIGSALVRAAALRRQAVVDGAERGIEPRGASTRARVR